MAKQVMGESMIVFEHVSKSYAGAGRPAVSGLDLEVRRGELLVLLGESGCGKTTTLKMVNRLIEPTSGRIWIGGEDHRTLDPISLRRRIGYVFQGIGLFPHMTVGENASVLLRRLGWKPAAIEARVDELLSLVGLAPGEYRDRLPAALSGGQQQRVGVARALAARPRIMLMDEPFGALDPLTRDDLQREYTHLYHQLELTSVMVTHDMTEALLMADRIAVMRNGRLLQLARPQELLTAPAEEYVAALMRTPREHADRLEALAGGGAESGRAR